MTSIIAALSLITKEKCIKSSPKAMKLFNIANQNGGRLLNLINDILDVEKIAAGRLTIDMEEIELEPFLKSAIEASKLYGEKFGVKFKLISAPKNVAIKADSKRLMQIMLNLNSNAAKFSNKGGFIDIKAEKKIGRGKNASKIIISVKDYGVGIPKDFQSKIFDKFSQADNSSTRSRQGTGLGLNIAQSLVETMNGKIYFESEEGKGATFYVEFPIVKKKTTKKKAKKN